MPEITAGTSAPTLNRSEVPSASRNLYLVGNPNVGKSVLFGALTGHYVTVSNYPGTTIEVSRGTATLEGADYTVLDTPGTNQLTPLSEDERVTRQLLLEHRDGVVVQVADSKNLRRALFLTLELAEMGKPVTLVLNMTDEARARGIRVDHTRLAELLGVPVVPMVATRKEGLEELTRVLPESRVPSEETKVRYSPELESRIRGIAALLEDEEQGARFLAVQLLSGDTTIGSYLEPRLNPLQNTRVQAAVREATKGYHGDAAEEIRRARLQAIDRILPQVFAASPVGRKSVFGDKLSRWALHPIKGIFFLGVLLYLTYWFVGLLGAGTLVDLTENGLFGQVLSPLAIRAVDHLSPFPHEHTLTVISTQLTLPLSPTSNIPLFPGWARTVPSTSYLIPDGTHLTALQQGFRMLHDFLVGPYGAITMGLSYGLAIVLPIVFTFFLLFSIMEDSGYLPRLAVMVNRLFQTMGLNGKAVLPMVLGLGCDTMATLTTRILETRKQRLITTLLLALGVPCSAQLGVLLGMLAHVTVLGAVVWCGVVSLVMIAVGFLASRLFPGERSDFLIELPPMRRPVISNIVIKTLARMQWYIREVLPLFILGTALLFVLDRTHALVGLRQLASPVVVHWLGLPREMADAFILGFLRRDYGAVLLLRAANGVNPLLNGTQVVVSMTVITLFIPCVANFFIIVREHGWKMASGMALFIFPFAFLVGGVVRFLALGLGLHF